MLSNLDPSNPNYLNHKGGALNYLKRYDEALDSFDHAINLDPSNPNYWDHKGGALNI